MYVKNIDDVMVALQHEVQRLKIKADDTIEAPVKLLPYKTPDALHVSLENIFKTKNSFLLSKNPLTTEQVEVIEKQYLEVYEITLKEIQHTHELNHAIIEKNKKIKDKIAMIMTTIGVYDTYNTYEFKTTRSKEKTKVKHRAGYISDLERCIPISDPFTTIKQNLDNKAQQVKEYAKKLKQDILKTEIHLQDSQNTNEKEKSFRLMYFAQKFGLADNAVAPDVFEALMNKDRYLRLYDALFEARTNFDEGYFKIKNTIKHFDESSDKNELDQRIIGKLKKVLNDWNGDNNIFRNSDVGYKTVRKLIKDENLFKDYESFKQYLENETHE
jgi:hypothetical protein